MYDEIENVKQHICGCFDLMVVVNRFSILSWYAYRKP